MVVFMQSQNKRGVLLIAISVFSVAFVLIIGFLLRDKPGTDGSIDKPSGETVSIPKDREVESFGVGANSITFYGVKELYNAGLTTFMVETFRNELNAYSAKNDNFIKSASVYVGSIEKKSDATEDINSFKLRLNESQDTWLEIHSTGLTQAQIILRDKDGKNIFTSQQVTYDPEEQSEYTGDGTAPEEF